MEKMNTSEPTTQYKNSARRYLEIREELAKHKCIVSTHIRSERKRQYVKKLEEEYDNYKDEWYFRERNEARIKKGQWVRNMTMLIMGKKDDNNNKLPAEMWDMIFQIVYDENQKTNYKKLCDEYDVIKQKMYTLVYYLKVYKYTFKYNERYLFDNMKYELRKPKGYPSIWNIKYVCNDYIKMIKEMSSIFKLKVCNKCNHWFKVQHKKCKKLPLSYFLYE